MYLFSKQAQNGLQSLCLYYSLERFLFVKHFSLSKQIRVRGQSINSISVREEWKLSTSFLTSYVKFYQPWLIVEIVRTMSSPQPLNDAKCMIGAEAGTWTELLQTFSNVLLINFVCPRFWNYTWTNSLSGRVRQMMLKQNKGCVI